MDTRVVIQIREFLFGRLQRVRVGRQLSEEGRVMSEVLRRSVLGPLLFLVYVNDIWRNLEQTIKLFPGDCIIYRKIINDNDIDTLQIDLDRLEQWALANAMKITLGKSQAVNFVRARVKDPLNYFCGDQRIPEASSCKYLGIILCNDLIWDDQVNYIVQRAWQALHFLTHVLKEGNCNTKCTA